MFRRLLFLLGLAKLYPAIDSLRAPSLCLLALPLLLLGCLSDSDKSNPGNSNPDSSAILRGAIQKGPFLGGSVLQVALLDTGLQPTGQIFTTTAKNDFGRFEVPAKHDGLAELTATGLFMSELTGKGSASTLRLQALIKIKSGDTQVVNLNSITHMAFHRARKLAKAGMSADTALAQAERELRKALPIYLPPGAGATPASSLDLLEGKKEDRLYLFGVSCILLQAARQGADSDADADSRLQQLLDGIALELEERGTLGEVILERIDSAQRSLLTGSVQARWGQWLKDKGWPDSPPDLDRLVDTDLDGLPNFTDRDDDGDSVSDDWDCEPRNPLLKAVPSNGVGCVDIYAPSAPDLIPRDGGLIVRVDSLPRISQYQLQYWKGALDDTAHSIHMDSISPLTGLTGLENTAEYRVRVRFQLDGLFSPWSKSSSAIPLMRPTLAGNSDYDRLTLKWSPVPGASSYSLIFRVYGSLDTSWKSLDIADSLYRFEGNSLIAGRNYEFSVAGKNQSGISTPSNPVRETYRKTIHTFDSAAFGNSGVSGFARIAFHPDGRPMVALNGRVLTLNGSAWDTVISGILSDTTIVGARGNLTDFAIDQNGQAYAMLTQPITDGLKFTPWILKQAGIHWKLLPSVPFGGMDSRASALSLDSQGRPLVAHSGLSTTGPVLLRHTEQNSWVIAGQCLRKLNGQYIDKCPTQAGEPPYSIHFGSDGTPILRTQSKENFGLMRLEDSSLVAFGGIRLANTGYNSRYCLTAAGSHYVVMGALEVWKLNGDNWERIGSSGALGAGGTTTVAAIADQGDGFYVAYTERVAGDPYSHLSMAKFDGHTLVAFGMKGFGMTEDRQIPLVSLAVDPRGDPWVVYSDVRSRPRVVRISYTQPN